MNQSFCGMLLAPIAGAATVCLFMTTAIRTALPAVRQRSQKCTKLPDRSLFGQ